MKVEEVLNRHKDGQLILVKAKRARGKRADEQSVYELSQLSRVG